MQLIARSNLILICNLHPFLALFVKFNLSNRFALKTLELESISFFLQSTNILAIQDAGLEWQLGIIFLKHENQVRIL